MTTEKRWDCTKPFWASGVMEGESLFFVRDGEDVLPSADLLLVPEGDVTIKSATGIVEYDQGKDFTVDPGSRTITLTSDTLIPFTDRKDLYRTADQKFIIDHKKNEPDVKLYFSEGHFYHDLQTEATYSHSGDWKGFVPLQQEGSLSRTKRIIRASEPLTICMIGDSITAGANSSKRTEAPPFMPEYGKLVADNIEDHFGSNVTYCNHSLGGGGAAYGVKSAPAAADEHPDLVIIGFGMNDVGQRDVENYTKNILETMNIIKGKNPEAEFILVASMLGNPEWSCTPLEEFPRHRDALNSLCGDTVVLADLTSMWTDLLKLKRFHDLTGNGVNHPNDFGHRIYAQVILQLVL